MRPPLTRQAALRQALPRRSSLLPAFRDPGRLLAQLQVRRRVLTDSGDLTEAARMAMRAARVVRWQVDAQMPAKAPQATIKQSETTFVASPCVDAVDAVDSLIAGLSLDRIFGEVQIRAAV